MGKFHSGSWRKEAIGLRWFSAEIRTCRMCGKRGEGTLYNYQNASYGEHCRKCAERRIADSKKREEHEAGRRALQQAEGGAQ